MQVFTAAGVTVDWDEQNISDTVDPRTNSFITRENLDSVLVRPLVPQLDGGPLSSWSGKRYFRDTHGGMLLIKRPSRSSDLVTTGCRCHRCWLLLLLLLVLFSYARARVAGCTTETQRLHAAA